ncbi:hypothetical protein J3459_002534 [Metarhizium acridum]|nr:hypothetical protein J3459_002534 [Metarhizium acridum]
MASPGFDDISIFDKTQVSSAISVDDAPSFFERYGVFYQASSEIGQLASSLAGKALSIDGIYDLKPIIEKDARLQSILAPYLKHAPSFCFTLGSDKGNFYALTTIEDPHPKVIVYVWLPGTQLEFSHGSHVGTVRGVPASNGLTHIPYSNLSKTRNLRDVSIKFHQGGTFIAHPRLALSITQGFGLGWGCKLAVKV